jgi:hypothetical protein
LGGGWYRRRFDFETGMQALYRPEAPLKAPGKKRPEAPLKAPGKKRPRP